MNILIFSLDNQPQFLGGIKRVSLILGKEWLLKGHHVSFLTYCRSSLKLDEIDGIKQFFFPDINDINSEINRQFLKKFLLDEDVEIVLNPHVEDENFTKLSFVAKSCEKVKLVTALHFSPTHLIDITSRSFFNSYYLGYDIRKWMRDVLMYFRFKWFKKSEIENDTRQWYNEVIDSSDKFVVLSKEFLSFFDGPEHKITYMNNPSVHNHEIEQYKKDKSIVWCGRLDVNGQKQVLTMLRIWKRIEDENNGWKLYILGNGDVPLINSYISKYKINRVEVAGFCNPFDYYKKAKIVAMTSSTEGWGMVLVEGQSCGCVPIAFGSYASIKDIISNHENGIIVKAFDEYEYARQLTKLIKDEEDWKRLSENAIESIHRFEAESIAQKWLELFLSI